jgi:hypothetical protein
MVLESFENRIDIKGLSLEAPEKDRKLEFDPDKEFTFQEWQNTAEEFRNSWKNRKPEDNVVVLSWGLPALKTFRPDLADPLLTDEVAIGLFHELDKMAEGHHWVAFSERAVFLKILFPDRVIISPDSKARVRTAALEEQDTFKAAQLGASLRILFPEDQFPKGLDQRWQKFASKADKDLEQVNMYSAVKYLANMKIMYPERFKDLSITPSRWQNLVSELHRTKSGNLYGSYAGAILDGTIVVAEDIKVSDKGLELALPHSEVASVTKPGLPQTRNF